MSYLIDIYDDQYNYIGTEDNKKAHRLGLWHCVFTCQFFNSERNTVFFQKKHPGMYSFERPNYVDITVGGHYEAGEKICDGIRELYEETSLNENEVCFSDLIPLGIRQTAATIAPEYIANEFQHLFLYDFRGELKDLVCENEETSGFVEVRVADVIDLLTEKKEEIESKEAFFVDGVVVVTNMAMTLKDFIPSYLKIDKFALRMMIAVERVLNGCDKEKLFW